MAVSSNMKRACRRVADILGAYARTQGWWPLDFRLYFRVDENWGSIQVLFISDGFERRDYFESHQAIASFLKSRTADNPELAAAVGFVVRTFKQVEEGGIYSVGSDYTFVRPRDLVKLTIRETAGLVAGYVKTQGWADQDYRIFYKVAPDQDRVHFALLVENIEDRDASERMRSFQGYANSRLVEEPEILNTLELEIKVAGGAGGGEIVRLEGAGFKDYYAFRRARSSL